MPGDARSRHLRSAARVLIVQTVTLALLFALQQAFSR
jgi:hypothetical protein